MDIKDNIVMFSILHGGLIHGNVVFIWVWKNRFWTSMGVFYTFFILVLLGFKYFQFALAEASFDNLIKHLAILCQSCYRTARVDWTYLKSSY